MPEKATISAIKFHFQHKGPVLRDRQKLKAFLLSIFKKEGIPVSSLSYIFCSDEYLLGINQQFLQHDYFTDIISFNLAGKNHPVEGEVYISLERIHENGMVLQQPYYRELHRVIFHGALHLCGYKDKHSRDISLMRKKEDDYLRLYFNSFVPRITVSG